MAQSAWTCWPTTDASVRPDSAVETVRKTSTSVRQTRASTEPRVNSTSTRTSVAVHVASAVFTAMSTTTTAPPGELTFYLYWQVTC